MSQDDNPPNILNTIGGCSVALMLMPVLACGWCLGWFGPGGAPDNADAPAAVTATTATGEPTRRAPPPAASLAPAAPKHSGGSGQGALGGGAGGLGDFTRKR